jgi:hypothetical protein
VKSLNGIPIFQLLQKINGLIRRYGIPPWSGMSYLRIRPLIFCKYADYNKVFTVKGEIFKWNSNIPIVTIKDEYYYMDKGESFLSRGIKEYEMPYMYPNIYRITFTIIPHGIEVNELNNINSKHYLIFETKYHMINIRGFVNFFLTLGGL